MPVLRKTINLTVSGNTLLATDSVTSAATSDAGVQGEDEAVLFYVTVPTDWQDLSVRLKVMSQDGGYDLSDLPVANVISMPLRQGLTMASGRLTVSLIGSTTAGVRKSADCKTLIVAASAQEVDLINYNYPHAIHNITGSGGALVTQTDNETYNVDVTGAGGDMLQANYANGNLSNPNTVDVSKSAKAAQVGSALETVIAAKMPTATYAAGTGHANTSKVDHAIATDTADAAYAGSVLAKGWTLISQILTFLSAADAPTFTATTSADLTPFISVGMKIMLTNATTKYFIVTAITSSTITLYGGTDYALTNVVISAVYYSPHKSPFGFPLDPNKWTVILQNNTNTNVGTLLAGTLATTGLSISVPIGEWNLSFKASMQTAQLSSTAELIMALSSSVSSISDLDLTASIDIPAVTWGALSANISIFKVLASKTTYTLIVKSYTATTLTYIRGDNSQTILKAVCAYL